MAYDATKPAIADNYSTGYTQTIRDNLDHVLKLGSTVAYGAQLSFTGTIPTGAKRYNVTSKLFEYYTGSAWEELPLDYLKLLGGQTVYGTVNFAGVLQEQGSRVWTAATFNPATKMDVSGGTFTGAVTVSDGVNGHVVASGMFWGKGGGGVGLGKITVQQGGSPPAGTQGDICFIW